MTESFLRISPERLKKRRAKVFGITFISVVLATIKWLEAIPADVSIFTRYLITILFILTFAWVSLFFWSNVFGFMVLLRKKKIPDISWLKDNVKLSTKTAVLMPVYNESPTDTIANLLAMAKALEEKGQTKAFDIFILSDTTNPKVWVEEERIWKEAKAFVSPDMNLYYRHRPKNIARKSGNIEDFCNRWGKNYDFMIVLDADSLITSETMIKMVQLMEKNHDTGIIQAPPVCINRSTLFARLQQFSSKVYGPVIASGLNYLQGCDSNYWGHNAIIRTKAFIECCGLPVLKGKAPFGGQILSHDFVEAALIRRGGWKAWLIPDLKGSYEESPPTMIDYAGRDRRWCQGEMQHIKLLTAKDFHPISKLHFLVGIMSYLSSPLWLSFLLIGLMIPLSNVLFPPEYFPEIRTLFPNWPVFDKVGTIYLFLTSMAMLLLPKFMGLFIYIKDNKLGIWSATKSTFVEIFINALFAPIMMMFQSKFVMDVFLGRSVGWDTQNRGDLGTSFRAAFKRHKWHMFLGAVTSVIVWTYIPSLFWWMLPITIGLMFSIPISIVSSKASVGLWAKKHGYFIIPEEISEPEILKSAKEFNKKLEKMHSEFSGIEALLKDRLLNNLHIFMLNGNTTMPDFSAEELVNAKVKLDNYILYQIPMDLSSNEEKALLYNPKVLRDATIAIEMNKKAG